MKHENTIWRADNIAVLTKLPEACVDLVYVDPPFNTGKTQTHTRLRTLANVAGERVGFGGKRYDSTAVSKMSYADNFEDYTTFLLPRLEQLWRVLNATGSLFLHLDPRESHYVKVAFDKLVGRDKFINEIIWAYDYGGRPRDRWPKKHDVIFWYAKNAEDYTFNYEEIDRIPYMAPSLVGAEKAQRGKTPTDVWWNTIVPTQGKERTGYPTQKPLGILNRIVQVHSNLGDTVLDCFAGSGTTGEAAARHSRNFLLIDENPEACAVMRRRLAFAQPKYVEFSTAEP